MRVITKNVLVQKLGENPCEYVSKLKLLHWLSIYGYDIKTEEDVQSEELHK